jgi:hypothetical protein
LAIERSMKLPWLMTGTMRAAGRRVERVDLGQDAPGDLDRVGVGLLADRHAQAALAVDADDAAALLVGVAYLGDLPQRDLGAVALGDHGRADLVQAR